MTRYVLRTCSSCFKFDLESSLSTGGRARCPSYEREVSFDNPATVLYQEASNREQRRAWAKQLTDQQLKEST